MARQAKHVRIIRIVRDDAKIARAHKSAGSEAQRELRKGRGAHVFNDDVDLDYLEQQVWTVGHNVGSVGGTSQRAGWDRFVWESPTPIGRRIQTGKPDQPLLWAEIKGKLNSSGDWVYHLVPRPRPPS